LIVQTVPNEFVHVPASAAGPEGVVAQAVINAINAPAKKSRRKDCIFMVAIVPGIA